MLRSNVTVMVPVRDENSQVFQRSVDGRVPLFFRPFSVAGPRGVRLIVCPRWAC